MPECQFAPCLLSCVFMKGRNYFDTSSNNRDRSLSYNDDELMIKDNNAHTPSSFNKSNYVEKACNNNIFCKRHRQIVNETHSFDVKMIRFEFHDLLFTL